MKALLLASLLLVTACDMTRKDTIEALKECEAANLRSVITINRLNNKVQNVTCLPKDEVQ